MKGSAASRLALGLPAALFGLAVSLRNRYYDRPGASVRAGLPVVSIGNMTAGGTGKTPLVARLARALLEGGRHPAVVSRGYGGDAGRGPLLVSEGDGPVVDAGRSGDEPWMLARRMPGLRVVVGSDRVAGAEAARRIGADVVLLDDGFQHRRLGRDLDVVLIDAGADPQRERLLPAGLLREPWSGLARADVLVATRCTEERMLAPIRRLARRHAASAPLVRAGHRPSGFVDPDGSAAPRPERVLAFCAVGRPASFRDGLRESGCEIVALRAFRDHHRFRPDELDALRREAARRRAVPVTTEKDLARLPAAALQLLGPLALRVEIELHDDGFLERAVATVAERAPSPGA